MTTDEIRTMSRVVAQHFGLWTPGEMCKYEPPCPEHMYKYHFLLECIDCGAIGYEDEQHEIPCPDLTQPEWAWQLLELTCADIYKRDKWWVQVPNLKAQPDARWPIPSVSGDNPREALLLATYRLVQREVPK